MKDKKDYSKIILTAIWFVLNQSTALIIYKYFGINYIQFIGRVISFLLVFIPLVLHVYFWSKFFEDTHRKLSKILKFGAIFMFFCGLGGFTLGLIWQ